MDDRELQVVVDAVFRAGDGQLQLALAFAEGIMTVVERAAYWHAPSACHFVELCFHVGEGSVVGDEEQTGI